MHPLAEALGQQWVTDFFSANQDLTWLAVEEERTLWLTPNTVLIGKMDARGITADGDPFFGEWKSKSGYWAKRMDEVKATWRRDPQALTYGLLAGADANRFLVRWALKSKPIQTAFEWYTYTPEELAWWRVQLIDIAADIRRHRQTPSPSHALPILQGPWRTNLTNCYRYGVKNACPFVATCPHEHNAVVGPPRAPHLNLEVDFDAAVAANPDLVVLGSTRVRDYLECPESYRRLWEGAGMSEDNEALQIGTDFHAYVANYLTGLLVSSKLKSPSKENSNGS